MQITNKILILVSCILLLRASLQAQPAENPRTFCNPLNLNYRFMSDAIDAREAADPVVVLFHDDYYLFASRSGGYWVSQDLRDWTLIVPTGLDVESYAPAVMVLRDSLFYIPSNNGQIYKTGDPRSGVWQKGPMIDNYGDPAFFLDEDERLYMYYGLSNNAPIRGVELDPVSFKEIGSRVDLLFAQASVHGWERRGDDNRLDEVPWIEGSWMIKKNGTYYLHYAGPGTEFKTYADGIYVADSPLGPYNYAEYSPFSFKPTGFICGAGHGSTFMDKDGQYWHIGTMTISVKHIFERRLGLYPVGFDTDGHIHCNTVLGDYPQYLPGEMENMVDHSFAGMLLLSHKKKVTASSSLAEHGATNAVDEDARTYWSAQTGGSDEWIMVDLGKKCTVEAIQVNFAEHNTNPEVVRGRDNLDILYEQYLIENSLDGMNWDMLVDKRQNLKDVPHDYIELAQSVSARYLKLTNRFTPGGGNFAVRGFRIFGNSQQAVFTPVNDFTVERDAADGRDAILRWKPVAGADGYIIRYGIAPDKLYNNYMVYDADSVAIHSLNHGVKYYFEVEAFDNGTDNYVPTGEFRSFQSGDYDEVNTWARHDGSGWVHPAPNVPVLTDGTITVLDGHTVTITASISADQLVLVTGGTLVIKKGVTLHIENDIGPDLVVEGTVLNYGSLTSDAQATLSFTNAGLYCHEQDGGAIPTAIWRSNSTCRIDSVKENAPANGNQNFHNVLWNCPDQTGNKNMGWNGNTISGNVIIENTGDGRWQMCAPAVGTAAVVNIQGDIIQSGGQFTSNGTSNANTTITINLEGNINVSGGNFSVSRGSQGGSGTTTWKLKGNVLLTNATTQNSNSTGAKFVFAGDGEPQMLSLTNVTYSGGGFPVEVDSGAVLAMEQSTLEGSGRFNLKAGATLLTGHVNGIDGAIANTGPRTLAETANYGFNGVQAQVTGNLLPETVNGLIINNEANVSLSNSVTVNGILEMVSGDLVLNGQVLAYGPEASLEYSGTTPQTTSDAEFPATGGPKNLIISNMRRMTLHDSRTVSGNLDLFGNLRLGKNTLTAGSASNANARAYVDTRDGGSLRLTSIGASPVLFPVGTNAYAPVWITNTGTVDDLSVNALRDTDDPEYGGRVNVLWNISESTAGGGNYTLQLGWVRSLENSDFARDRMNNARIYNMTDTTEVGTGNYTWQLATEPYFISRAGITELGPFAVGGFREMTGIDNPSQPVPKQFILRQNYPNPFNPLTAIDFSIARPSRVKVVIYDITGKEVALLINGKIEAGAYTVQWNASEQASGIYIAKLVTNHSVQARKMILLK